MAARLLASSPTLPGITAQINKFWCSDAYTVNPETLAIEHPSKTVNPSVRVRLARGRYRFEMGQ